MSSNVLHLRAAFGLVTLLGAAAASLHADWKFMTRESYNGRVSEETVEYCKDGMTRTQRSAGGHPGMTLLDLPGARSIMIDPHSQEYTDSSTFRKQSALIDTHLAPFQVTFEMDASARKTVYSKSLNFPTPR